MSSSISAWLLIVVALVAANLPFLTDRLAGLRRLTRPKPLWMRLLELMVAYLLVGAFGLWLERQVGQIAPQGWEFYAVTGALFLTFAFPGFVWRYLAQR